MITCPRCGWTSHHPDDASNGYCGNCHEFTSDTTDRPQPPDVAGSGYLARQVARGLSPLLATLDLPSLLPTDPTTGRGRTMLFEGDGISLRHGGSLFYDDNGQPIGLPDPEAVREINTIRARDGGELRDETHSATGVPITVATSYVGVDLSTGGPVPLVWETRVFIGDGLPRDLEPWRYASRAAAHAGHARVVAAVQSAVQAGG